MIALIDADHIIYTACHNKKKLIYDLELNVVDQGIEEKTLEDCKECVDDYIYNILDNSKATHYLLFLTVGKCFRYTINPEYKANRKDLEKPKWFNEIKQYLIDKYKAIYLKNELEADDFCLLYYNFIKSELNPFIVSPDKDLLNLHGQHYNPKTHTWVNNTLNEAEFNKHLQLLTGDTVDNIKGLPGIGIKKATKILEYGKPDLIKDTFNIYIDFYKNNNVAIDEFYKNYKCLTILDSYNIEFIEPIEFNKEDYAGKKASMVTK